MEYTPYQTDRLVVGHASSAFSERGNRKRIGKSKRRFGFRLEEQLVGDTAVLVLVASPLTHCLRSFQ